MSKIVFDPELMQHIKTIYGDAELNERTLKLIYNTWKANPDWIRNTAQLKLANKLLMTPVDVPVLEPVADPILSPVEIPSEVADDDLSNINDFNKAFSEARRRGLKVFNWKKTKGNPSGLFGTLLASTSKSTPKKESNNITKTKPRKTPVVEVGEPVMMNPYATYSNNGMKAFIHETGLDPESGEYTRTVSTFLETPDKDMYGRDVTKKKKWEYVQGSKREFQQGGTMNNQEELLKAFMAYLIQDAANLGILLQSEQDLQLYAELLGEEGIKAKYQEFMLRMQGGVKARLGAKLDYYKKLKGVCPDGLEPTYLKQGGKMTKVCRACEKGKKLSKGLNEVDKFKAERAKMKKK